MVPYRVKVSFHQYTPNIYDNDINDKEDTDNDNNNFEDNNNDNNLSIGPICQEVS